MIAVDTNVVVRLLTGDDKQQFDRALHLFEKQSVFIPDSVILEMEWVLRFAYGFTPEAICDAYDKLFGLPNVHTANPALISHAIQWHKQGLDFADALHLALCQKYDLFFTFDKGFIRKAVGLGQCSVLNP
uniref:Predicted nucleic acid-binding protein, contains PIN domain n=1 Tax=Candidatus Kentrum sp. FM TaxID=2126340 RepID=A0A450SJ07_9GAMM|nr:MAG: Predicted nucleic acid-binding protein, contains PIN domain [Candidatus Kentron sp. FM]VFJ54609.1 MAG: Predicted nucleic acid-binding protein, contains PIN domain [Candidatus Kentron sp. FM]VFK10378.1 MAG: Predicted nucleic acid-binding protein, contains PIN domain [Candidatus Kentron sp. FM]